VRARQTPKQLSFSFIKPEVLIDQVRVYPYAKYTSNAPTLIEIYRDFGLDGVQEAILSQNRILEDLPWRVVK